MNAHCKALAAIAASLLLAGTARAQWLNYATPGIPRLPDGKPNLSAPPPRATDGKPDLSGIWAVECGIYGRDACFTKSLFFDLARDLKPEDVEMTPWAKAIQAQRESRDHVDDPYGYCLPPGSMIVPLNSAAIAMVPRPAASANARIVLLMVSSFESKCLRSASFQSILCFPVGASSRLPADGGAFCPAEDCFGLVQQLPTVLMQGAVLPGQFAGRILHHFPAALVTDLHTCPPILYLRRSGNPRLLLRGGVISCECVRLMPAPSAVLPPHRSRLPEGRKLFGLPLSYRS
jgi:hypothetical protein